MAERDTYSTDLWYFPICSIMKVYGRVGKLIAVTWLLGRVGS